MYKPNPERTEYECNMALIEGCMLFVLAFCVFIIMVLIFSAPAYYRYVEERCASIGMKHKSLYKSDVCVNKNGQIFEMP